MKTAAHFYFWLRASSVGLALTLVVVVFAVQATAQEYGEPDRGEPGDQMIQRYLARVADELHGRFLEDVQSLDDWQQRREQYKDEYLYMLGLSPLPDKTPLEATVTGVYEGDDFVVEKLHYQSRPQLYVTANLYRPKEIAADQRLPAVLYVCGHSSRGRNGNKTAFQPHGIWFARHGYLCLVLDTLQLGEIAAVHHGTYRENRWWWHSRGYTPAGVECWNGVRGIDYLLSRPEVDPERIAVTGISGGGAATFWVAAADDRAAVAIPVSGMADLPSYIGNRVINGHCDCMFLYNTFRWPWTRIAALIAPRPLLFVNSDQDPIFPMDANERVVARLERLYSLYGVGDQVDAVVSIGGHAYRQDIRQAAFRFANLWLQQDPRLITDSEVDLGGGEADQRSHPIDPEKLRVFATDDRLPQDQLNTTIDEHFVPLAQPGLPEQYSEWKSDLLAELRRVVFGYFPENIPAGKPIEDTENKEVVLESEPGIRVHLLSVADPSDERDHPRRVILVVDASGDEAGELAWLDDHRQSGDLVYVCQPRGIGPTRWTHRNPPNYVERAHVLLGRTVDAGRIWDILAAAGYLRDKHGSAELSLAGRESAATLAAYAALLDDQIDSLVLHAPKITHSQSDAPQLLNVLRVCDVPDVLGMLAPRRQVLSGVPAETAAHIRDIYEAAGGADKLQILETR